jgi:hypothetical protein
MTRWYSLLHEGVQLGQLWHLYSIRTADVQTEILQVNASSGSTKRPCHGAETGVYVHVYVSAFASALRQLHFHLHLRKNSS